MAEKNQIFKCEVCGHVIEVLHEGEGELVCCGEPMILKDENTKDGSTEKHVPVVEIEGNEVIVKVGDISHPMEEKHHIEWIEVITKERVYREDLRPGKEPEARFVIEDGQSVVKIREYCNVHGLWKK